MDEVKGAISNFKGTYLSIKGRFVLKILNDVVYLRWLGRAEHPHTATHCETEALLTEHEHSVSLCTSDGSVVQGSDMLQNNTIGMGKAG